MKTHMFSVIVLAALLMTSCTSTTQSGSVEPLQATSAPTVISQATAKEPTQEAPLQTETSPENTLRSQPWQWVSFTNPVEAFDVPIPDSYTLAFNADGSLSIQADCNRAGSSYVVEGTKLTITPSPATMAACPPGSLSDMFLKYLPFAAGFFFKDGNLYIDMMADGGTLKFAPLPQNTQTNSQGAQYTPVLPDTSSNLPAAVIAHDDGGPVLVTGEWPYTSYLVATHFPEPSVALMDVSRKIGGDYSEWVPRTGQILGLLTSPISPPPAAFQIGIPLLPEGEAVDLDNDGEQDAGIQVFAAHIGPNLTGDSYLEQVEQVGYSSYLMDPQAGAFREGTFLVFAPDDKQGFPSSAGEDQQYFTADDPAVNLPAGYTLVTLGRDGKVSFDRSRQAKMDLLETASAVSPDFSSQGILESYNSLVDVLKVRYSYTDLRGIDWEQVRQQYLPQVQAADQDNNFTNYFLALNDLALSIRDAHVSAQAKDAQITHAPYLKVFGEYNGSLGAQVVKLSNGRFVVTFLDPEGPGAQAGWKVGTEIVSVDGIPMAERIAALPLLESEATPDGIQTAQMRFALAFPASTKTTIEYRQPGETTLLSKTLTAGADFHITAPITAGVREEISFKELEGGNCYIQWSGFNDPLYKIAVWEKFLSKCQTSPGMIIDMRDNGGGSLELMYTLASYLFSPEKPAELHWLDTYVYDDKTNDLVKEFESDYKLTSPKPELAYSGAVVVLVNQGTASAGEYFPQFLQRQGRAIVIGEYGTEGAGGPIERASMPGGITFTFTKGRTYFAGTDELNLEAKGVTLDHRVPISVENELARQNGRDPVLEEALTTLGEEAARRAGDNLSGTTWRLMMRIDPSGRQIPLDNPDSYQITFGEDGNMPIQADCNQSLGEYTLGPADALSIRPGSGTLSACPAGSLSEDFLKWLAAATAFETDRKQLLLSLDQASGVYALLFDLVK